MTARREFIMMGIDRDAGSDYGGVTVISTTSSSGNFLLFTWRKVRM